MQQEANSIDNHDCCWEVASSSIWTSSRGALILSSLSSITSTTLPSSWGKWWTMSQYST